MLFSFFGHSVPSSSDQGPAVPRTQDGVEAALSDVMTLGYKPNLPIHGLYLVDGFGNNAAPSYQFWFDVESMRRSPHVRDCLNIYMGGIWPAKFKIRAASKEIGEYVHTQLRRFWERSLRSVQEAAYTYGWVGGEVVCTEERGYLGLDSVTTFNPRDVRVLTRNNQFAGIRVMSANPMGGRDTDNKVDLWGPAKNRPGKAFWYAHNTRFGQWYGESQLLGAWRPWRRLDYPDGAVEVIDGGFYRFAYCGPVLRYPKGSDRADRQAPGTERQDFRDKALEMAEGMKAGASLALPSTRDDKGNLLWEMQWPDRVLNLSGLLEYHDTLVKEIAFGIGVPPELREASDTGSGYSGRAIPKETFYGGQQYLLSAFIRAIRQCFLDGLVAWCFGPDAWYEIEPEPLLQAQQQQTQGQPGGAGGGGLADLLGGMGGGGAPGGEPQPGGDEPPADDDGDALDLNALFGDVPDDDDAPDLEGPANLGWQPELTSKRTIKAIGNGPHAGQVLYGDDAQRALRREWKQAAKRGEMSDHQAKRNAKELRSHWTKIKRRNERREKIRAIVRDKIKAAGGVTKEVANGIATSIKSNVKGTALSYVHQFSEHGIESIVGTIDSWLMADAASKFDTLSDQTGVSTMLLAKAAGYVTLKVMRALKHARKKIDEYQQRRVEQKQQRDEQDQQRAKERRAGRKARKKLREKERERA